MILTTYVKVKIIEARFVFLNIFLSITEKSFNVLYILLYLILFNINNVIVFSKREREKRKGRREICIIFIIL